MLQNLLPDLRADAGGELRPEESHSVVVTQPLPIPSNWELMLSAQERGGPVAVAGAGASTVTAPRPPVRDVEPREIELLQQAHKLTALAKLILDPPNLRHGVSAFTLSEVHPPAIGVGGNGDGETVAQQNAENPPLPLDQPVNASGGGDLLFGAGGGAAGGKPELYVLPENKTLQSNNVVVGDAGHAVFRQLGDHHIAGDLTLAREKGSTGRYELQTGTLTAQREVIGDFGEGSFIQQRGVNIVEQSIIVGKNGAGSYYQSGGDTIVRNTVVRTTSNSRTNSGGGTSSGGGGENVETVTFADNGLHLGEKPGSTGNYTLDGGTLSATPQVIGDSGTGTFVQNGGENSSGAILIGSGSGGVGNYQLIGGKLVLLPLGDALGDATTGTPVNAEQAGGGTIRIGDNGYGKFTFGNSGGTGTVYSVGDDNSVVVRGKPTGDGVIVGHGKFKLAGSLVNNSQIIADGYRKDRTLDLSSFTKVTSNIENPPWGGAAGWFARRKGKLLLPPIHVAQGAGEYTWGEDDSDPLIDLVNSVRLKIDGAQQEGDISIALLSPLRSDIPALPEKHKFIGLWSLDTTGVGDFEGMDIQVRYDDAMADTLGLQEHILKLWEYNGATATWTRLDGEASFARDTFNHIVSGRLSSDATYFAVSAPEPSGAVLVMVAGAALLRRRHRRRRS
jgi:hypothetical protein